MSYDPSIGSGWAKGDLKVDPEETVPEPIYHPHPILGPTFGPLWDDVLRRYTHLTGRRFDDTAAQPADDDDAIADTSALRRLRKMFERDDLEQRSPELLLAFEIVQIGTLFGALLGTRRVKGLKAKFTRYHSTTIWQNPVAAQKKLADTMMYHGMKGAIIEASRWFAMSSVVVSTMLAVQALRNQSGVLEYTAAGGVLGALTRFHMGPRGALVAAGFGCIGGTLSGSLLWAVASISGMTLDEVKKLRYEQHREALVEKRAEEARKRQEKDETTLEHNTMWRTIMNSFQGAEQRPAADELGQVPNVGFEPISMSEYDVTSSSSSDAEDDDV